MKYKLGDICEEIREKILTSDLSEQEYISTDNMIVNRGGVIDAVSLPSSKKVQSFKCGDVLVSNIRPYFKKIWHATFEGGCSNDVLVFRAKQGVSGKFLYYTLSDDAFFSYATSTAKGTKMPRGDKEAIMEYPVDLPSYELQEKRVILPCLFDELINYSSQINKNLIEQLKFLFIDKIINNPKIDFVTQIPLVDLCSVITKGTTPTTLGKAFTSTGINFLKVESISELHSFDKSKFAHIDLETHKLLKRSIIKNKDILFTIAGTLGRFALVNNSILPANTNQAIAIIRANPKKISPEYLFSCLIGNWHNDYYSKRIQQSVQANLSLTTIKSLPIPVLQEKDMEDYLAIVNPIINMLDHISSENEYLLTIRDTLLPKLMSGEIDISNIKL